MSGSLISALSDAIALIGGPAPLVIGQLVLEGHEVPNSVTVGGRQAVVLHKMPGGNRIIDAMGADDGVVSWRGMFVGLQAARRARILDVMRRSGLPQTLSFADYSLDVIIVRYEYSYQERGAVIPYRIETEIVTRPSASGADGDPGPDLQIQLDLGVGLDVLQAGLQAAAGFAGLTGRSDSTQIAASTAGVAALLPALDGTGGTAAVTAAPSQAAIAMIGAGSQAALQALAAQGAASAAAGAWFADAPTLAASASRAALTAALVRSGSSLNRIGANLAAIDGSSSVPFVYS